MKPDVWSDGERNYKLKHYKFGTLRYEVEENTVDKALWEWQTATHCLKLGMYDLVEMWLGKTRLHWQAR